MLTTQDKMLIEQRITNEKHSPVVAYLLLIFVGLLGAHRFYLGRIGTGVVMLLLTITIYGLLISVPWAIIDLFLVPSIIRERVEQLRQKLTTEALADSQPAVVASPP